MRSHARLRKYLERIKGFFPNATISRTKNKLLRFAFWNHEARDSTMGDSIPIWADGMFQPARVRLIRGKTELLLGMGIIKKLDLTVNFGGTNSSLGREDGK